MWSRRNERWKEQSRRVESGCVKRSVKGKRGKEPGEVRDAWRKVSEGGEGRRESLKVSSVVRVRPLPRKLKGSWQWEYCSPTVFHPAFLFLVSLVLYHPPPVSASVKVCHPATFVIVLVQGVCRVRLDGLITGPGCRGGKTFPCWAPGTQ